MGNLEQVILLLVSSQGILLSVALISSVIKKNYSNLFLGLITLIISLEILNTWGMKVGYHSSANPFPFWILSSYLVMPPALLLFVKINTQPTFHLKPQAFFLFVPAIIEITSEFFTFYSNKLVGTNYHLIKNPYWFAFTEILPVFAMVAVLLIYWIGLKSLVVQTNELSIKKSLLHSSKLYGLFIVFTLLTIFWFIQGILGFQVFFIIEIILTSFLFILGYIGYFHPAFFDIPKFLKNHISKEEFLQYDDKKELPRLASLFENEKIYTKPRLTLEAVAGTLNLPPRYISGLISSYHNTDFRNFVNSYRVNEVIGRIKDPKYGHLSLFGIAMDSGFNSKSSFNQIFKTFTGQKPSDYLKK